jgi:hypothetical protein
MGFWLGCKVIRSGWNPVRLNRCCLSAATNRFALPSARRIEMRRLVQSDIANFEEIRELRVEAEGIEATYGPNAYSDFLRRHGRRPDPETAAVIGRLFGGRVKADDGTMQPRASRIAQKAKIPKQA